MSSTLEATTQSDTTRPSTIRALNPFSIDGIHNTCVRKASRAANLSKRHGYSKNFAKMDRGLYDSILAHPDLDATERDIFVHLFFARRHTGKNLVYTNNSRLASDLKRDVKTIRKKMKSLLERL